MKGQNDVDIHIQDYYTLLSYGDLVTKPELQALNTRLKCQSLYKR